MSEGKVGDRACPRCSREFPSVEMANEHRNHCWSTGPTDDASPVPDKGALERRDLITEDDLKPENVRVVISEAELTRLKRENEQLRSIIDDMIKTYFVYGTSATTDDVFKQARMILKDGGE